MDIFSTQILVIARFILFLNRKFAHNLRFLRGHGSLILTLKTVNTDTRPRTKESMHKGKNT